MSVTEENIKPEPKQSLKFAPWISAIIILIYSVLAQFLLIASMESAFDAVEDFFEQWSSSWTLIEIPLPLILAVIFYYYSQNSRSRNITLFLYSLVSLATAVLAIVVYVIMIQFPIQGQYTDFIFILTATIVSILVSFVAVLMRKTIVNRRSLQQGSFTRK